jgi:hypothetical protein
MPNEKPDRSKDTGKDKCKTDRIDVSVGHGFVKGSWERKDCTNGGGKTSSGGDSKPDRGNNRRN